MTVAFSAFKVMLFGGALTALATGSCLAEQVSPGWVPQTFMSQDTDVIDTDSFVAAALSSIQWSAGSHNAKVVDAAEVPFPWTIVGTKIVTPVSRSGLIEHDSSSANVYQEAATKAVRTALDGRGVLLAPSGLAVSNSTFQTEVPFSYRVSDGRGVGLQPVNLAGNQAAFFDSKLLLR